MVFDKNWFVKHQNILLFLLNTPLIRVWFRWLLKINGNRSSVGKRRIIKIEPNAIWWKYGRQYQTEFRTHNKFSKRLYYGLYPLWMTFHLWDFLTKPIPALNLGFDTLTAYPAAGANSPVDGRVYRGPVSEDFATIRAGAGSTASATDASESYVYLQSDGATYSFLVRSYFLFDCSSIPLANTISSAILSLFGTAKANGLGAAEIDIVASTPAATNTLATTDYGNIGSTPFASITYADYSTADFNNFSLNASGIANISKGSGISKFGARLNWDTDNSFGGAIANAVSSFSGYYADQADTTNDPKLVVTHSSSGGLLTMGEI